MSQFSQWLAGLPSGLRRRSELRPLAFFLGLDDGADARAAYHQTLARNLRLLARLDEILDCAEARGLTLLPYKGAALAGSLYPDVGTRPMADIDLLVVPGALEAAIQLLQELGFWVARPAISRYSPRHTHDVAMTDGAVYVELHFRLFHELELVDASQRIFDRSKPTRLYDRERRTPCPDDHLMILALHAATHAYADSPMWLVDIALLIDSADRQVALSEAVRCCGGRAFSIAMQLFDHPAIAALWIESPPGRMRSLLTRAALVEGPMRRTRWLGRKLTLTAQELLGL